MSSSGGLRVKDFSLLKPALEKLPKWFDSSLSSIGSTTRTLISPNAILESLVLCGDIAVISFHRRDRRNIWIGVEKVECAVCKSGVREAGLDGLIDVQDIRVLVQ